MKRITSTGDIKDLGAVLFVGAHPDDEVFLAGGILAACVRNGQRVACVTATHGEEGVQDEKRWPRSQLAEVRAHELDASLAVLGVRDLRWLDYHDGACDAADASMAAEKLRALAKSFEPDTILTFGPDGQTGHPDHKAVCRWTRLAYAGTATRVLWSAVEKGQYEQLREADQAANIFFKMDQPPLEREVDLAIDFRLPADLTVLKRRAFEAVESQFGKILATHPFERPGEGLARECFIEAKGGEE